MPRFKKKYAKRKKSFRRKRTGRMKKRWLPKGSKPRSHTAIWKYALTPKFQYIKFKWHKYDTMIIPELVNGYKVIFALNDLH